MDYTAHMDPWCVLESSRGLVLFGYCITHQSLGGLAWSCSSPIVDLDEQDGWAATQSGRVYKLGQKVHLVDMGSAEALCAAALLLGLDVGLSQSELVLAEDWVRACKAARWLGLEPPPRVRREVDAFLAQHGNAYLDLRQKKGLH